MAWTDFLDQYIGKDDDDSKHRNPGWSDKGELQRGYLPGTQDELRAYMNYLGGKGDTSNIPKHLLSNQYGHSARFAARASMYDIETNADLERHRQFLRQLQGGAAGRMMRDAQSEAVSRSDAASRQQAEIGYDQALGGGMEAGGMKYYINRQMDNALAGQMGDAYRAAAMADIQARFQAGASIQNLQSMKANAFSNIINAEQNTAQLAQKTTQGGSIWGDMLSQAVGGVAGYFTGGIAGGAAQGLTSSLVGGKGGGGGGGQGFGLGGLG